MNTTIIIIQIDKNFFVKVIDISFYFAAAFAAGFVFVILIGCLAASLKKKKV